MTFDKVKELIVDNLNTEEDKVTIDANLKEDLDADSLDAVELIMAIEDEFEIEIPDDKAAEIKTVKDIVDYIDNNN
ncbi:MAG: acyl carrier protein [Thomasclavelia sp.]|nr:acyl carrier protein [Thomasclavelia sp.]